MFEFLRNPGKLPQWAHAFTSAEDGVSADILHTWIGDLRVSLLSPAGTEVILQDGVGGSDDNLVRTFTTANTPLLATFAGQPAAGTWRLKVVDRAAEDVGKLNSWRLIKPPAA